MPKFWRYIRREHKAGRKVGRAQVWLRFNYMASIAWASLGLVFLLLFPYNSQLLSPIILAAAVPYFLCMSYDFHRLGYKRSDVFRVYGFNLILLPVNLAGTFKSLQQAAAKSKIAFARTPKVQNRTAAPALFVLFAYLIAVFSFYTLQNDIVGRNWSNAIFAGFNGLLTTYSIIAFIGIRNSIVDVAVGMAQWVRVPVKPKKNLTDAEFDAEVDAGLAGPADDWEAVLYFGPGSHPDETGIERVPTCSPPGPRRGDTRARHRGGEGS
jgi:hypothetical protein